MAIAESITPEDAIRVLNRALKADPAAVAALALSRTACNQALADDPTVQVLWERTGGYHVGLLGILNGLFGVDEGGWGAIGADVEDGEIRRFRVLTEDDRRMVEEEDE